jgi:GNAT superfamily N-acetyltransferase
VLVANVETPSADARDLLESVYAIDHLAAAGDGERRRELGLALLEGRMRVVWDGTRVVGYSVMAPWWFGAAFLQLVYVAREHRRSGLGQLLVEDVENLAPRPIFTSTNETNLPMRRLLDARHWVRCGYLDSLDENDPEVFYRSVRQHPYCR